MLKNRFALTSSIFLAVFVPMVACSADPIYYGDPVDTEGDDSDSGPGSIKVDGGKVDGSSKDAGRDASKKDASKDASKVKDAGLAPEGSPCTTTKPEETTCGACGTKSRACLDDGKGNTVWGAWGSCIGELVADDACDPDQTYADEACGNCGKRQRVCGLDCRFVAGLSCTEPTSSGGEAACSPGSKEFLLGASCTGANQGRYRTCDPACKWSTPGGCETFTVNASAASISASTTFACSLLPNSKIKCWGDGNYGQLGNGTATDSTTPVEVSGLTGAMSLGSGYYHTCAIVSGGAVKCWGYNYYGSLGNGSTAQTTEKTPIASLITSGAQAITSGTYHSCALMSGGTVKCWGYNGYGQLGIGGISPANKATVVPNLTGVLAISSGASHTCAIVTGGGVKCWGYNSYGQVGNASNTTVYSPVDVSGLTSGALAISAGGSHTCAVVAGGGVKCWGDNSNGALGTGNNTSSNVPVQVQGLGGASSLAAGANFTCVRMGNGAGKCWGYNNYGSLGNGSNANSNVPVNISNLP